MSAQREYTPPIELDGGTIEIDTTPDHDGDLEITNRDGDHIVYLKPADQIALRDLLHSIHPTKPRTITTAEELDALPNESVVLDARNLSREGLKATNGRNYWRSMGPAKVLTSNEIALPATVLYEPQP